MSPLQMQSKKTPRGTIISFVGDAGVDHVEQLDAHLSSIESLPPGLFVIDMSGVTYIGSIGLGMLIRFQGEVGSKGGTMRLAAIDTAILDAIHTARLDEVLEIHPTVEIALAAKPSKPKKRKH